MPPTSSASMPASAMAVAGVVRGHQGHDRGEDQRRHRRVGSEHQDPRRPEHRVADEAGDRGVEPGDRREPGQLGVGHALGHQDGRQHEAGDQIGAQPPLLVRARGTDARDPALDAVEDVVAATSGTSCQSSAGSACLMIIHQGAGRCRHVEHMKMRGAPDETTLDLGPMTSPCRRRIVVVARDRHVESRDLYDDARRAREVEWRHGCRVVGSADMSTEQGSAVSGGQRALAWLSIGCGLVLTVILVVFAVRNLPALLGVVVGLADRRCWWVVADHRASASALDRAGGRGRRSGGRRRGSDRRGGR